MHCTYNTIQVIFDVRTNHLARGLGCQYVIARMIRLQLEQMFYIIYVYRVYIYSIHLAWYLTCIACTYNAYKLKFFKVCILVFLYSPL
jgi:hypothetical protein